MKNTYQIDEYIKLKLSTVLKEGFLTHQLHYEYKKFRIGFYNSDLQLMYLTVGYSKISKKQIVNEIVIAIDWLLKY